MLRCGPFRVAGCGLLLLLCAAGQSAEEFQWWLSASHCEENGGFRCANQNCIYESFRCDGYNQCGDNSDEENCGTYTCLEDNWRCPNMDKCLAVWQVCDGEADCDGGLDETATACEERDCSKDHLFLCGNGQCIHRLFRCNGYDSCGDNTDEVGCDTATCVDGLTKCANNHRCIFDSSLCNGNNDCGDNWDEDPENCIAENCDERGNFRCDNNICRSIFDRCDGKDDCGDNSDEEDCETSQCPQLYVKCPNHRCVSLYKLCDGKDDCGDNWDETNHFCDAKK